MKRKKRAASTALLLFLCFALIFLLWVDGGFGRYSVSGRYSLPPERLLRQLMLPDAEEICRPEEGIVLYDTGRHLLLMHTDIPFYSLCEFENGAAFLTSPLSFGPNAFKNDIWLPIYAYTRSPDAAFAEMELFISSTTLSSDPEKPMQGDYLFPSVPCENGVAYFPMSWNEGFVGEESLITSFSNCVMNGSSINGVYYRAALRFYDAEGELISDSMFELGKKES